MTNLTTNRIPKATGVTQIDDGSITDSGGVIIGAPTGGAQGVGTLNTTGSYVNGNLLTSGHGAQTASAGAATLNQGSGIITSEALVGATAYTLTLTNSVVVATSTVLVNATNSDSLAVFIKSVTPGAGTVTIIVGMAALTGTVKVAFAVFN